MADKGTAFRNFTAAAQADAPDGAGESRLRIPTVEERALIFLRATRRGGDFNKNDHEVAREKILAAMADEIVSRPSYVPSDEGFAPHASDQGGEAVSLFDAMACLRDEPPPAGVSEDQAEFKHELALRLSSSFERSVAASARMMGNLERSRAAMRADLDRVEDTTEIALSAVQDALMVRDAEERIGARDEVLFSLRRPQDRVRPPPRRDGGVRRVLYWLFIAIVAGLSLVGAATLVRMGLKFSGG